MKFAIISDIHLGDESEFKGVVRKLSRHSMTFLSGFVNAMNTSIRPIFAINLGDSINDVSHDIDMQNFKTVLTELRKLDCPIFNVVGNHEQWSMSKEEIETLLDLRPLCYSKDIEDHHVVILFSEAQMGEGSRISEAQEVWLADDLSKTDRRTIVFVHHSLADQDLRQFLV